MRSRLRTWFIAGLIVFPPVVITFSMEMSVDEALKIVMSGGIVSSALRLGSGAALPTTAEEAC